MRDALTAALFKVRPFEAASLLKRLLGTDRAICDLDGLRMWLDPATRLGRELHERGIHEPAVTSLVRAQLRPGDVFVDVGANEGWFSLVAARSVGPSGRVVAVEPQSRLWPVLRRNFELNGVNALLVPAAVSEVPGRVKMRVSPEFHSGMTTLRPRGRALLWRTEWTDAEPLDALLDRIGVSQVHLVKVDVEGGEGDVLRSARRWLADQRIEQLLVELHEADLVARGEKPREVLRPALEAGYVATDLPRTDSRTRAVHLRRP